MCTLINFVYNFTFVQFTAIIKQILMIWMEMYLIVIKNEGTIHKTHEWTCCKSIIRVCFTKVVHFYRTSYKFLCDYLLNENQSQFFYAQKQFELLMSYVCR